MGKLNTTVVGIKHPTMRFSSGHFTIFSATDRESLHGHNYTVELALTTVKPTSGLNFDYREYREFIVKICRSLDKLCLLPANSAFLKVNDNGSNINCIFNNEEMSFLKSDTMILPLENITIEELSKWFLDQLLQEKEKLQIDQITNIKVKVYNSPFQSGQTEWQKTSS